MRRHASTLALATAVWLSTPASLLAQEAPMPPPAANAIELSLATQIVDVAFPLEDREALFFGTIDQMIHQTREAFDRVEDGKDEGAREIVDQWIAEYVLQSKEVARKHIPSLMDGLSRSYAALFTRSELEDILAFAQTESGRRYFRLAPAIIAEPHFAQANQDYMNEVLGGLPDAQKELMGRLMEYYASKQAEAPHSEG